MRGAGMDYQPATTYARVDLDRAVRIAEAYENAQHRPNDPDVRASYAAMLRETLAQYQVVKETGLKVEFIDFEKGGDPYGNPRNAILDVVRNNHLWIFGTSDGFGPGGLTDAAIRNTPLLADSGEVDANGKKMLMNDVFRVVHDYFGHVKEGVGFRADGEENAWRSHVAMYSPIARGAMTTETRGQNSWVNYGPHAESNRTANGADTKYAEQKVTLLPDWVVNEGSPLFSRKEPNYTFEVIDTRTKEVVGQYQSRRTANQAVDRLDNRFGAYRYRAQPIEGAAQEERAPLFSRKRDGKPIEVTVTAYEEETGRRVRMKVPADQALSQVDADIAKAKELLACLMS